METGGDDWENEQDSNSGITTPMEEDTLIILDDDLSRVASPPIPPLSARETPGYSLRSNHNANVDIQGIPWHLSLRLGRAEYRMQRSLEYALLEQRRDPQIYTGADLLPPGQECSPPLYHFAHLDRTYPATAQHFQLRHLVASPTLSSVFFTYGNLLVEWDPARGTESVHLNFRERVGPHTRITALTATKEVIIVGGFYGELVVSPIYALVNSKIASSSTTATTTLPSSPPSTLPLITPQSSLFRLTHEENGITNHISPFNVDDSSRFVISSNDSIVRLFDTNQGGNISVLYRADTAVNAAAVSPHGRMLCLAADSPKVDIIDLKSGKRALQLAGHLGFTFACDWSPDGRWLCTGNEDHTARIYDVRASSQQALYVIGSRMAPIRDVRFSPDGLTLAVMEESDFVVLYDSKQRLPFHHCTTIDFFGETSGISFTPDSERLYIGCGEASAGGIFEFVRRPTSVLSLIEGYRR